jgi:hypothetical protein
VKTLDQRFHEKVHYEPMTGCWLWGGAIGDTGYGTLMEGGKGGGRTVRAHVVAWRIHRGPVPVGLYVCHKCDVRWCVNPDHLFVGTALDNNRDKMRKGRCRTQVGSERRTAKLDDAAARDIVARYGRREPLRSIARHYGIAMGTVTHLLTGRSWSHATGIIRTTKEEE